METEEKVWRIFGNVNEWLKYAEQKNALTLTFLGIQLTALGIFIEKIQMDCLFVTGAAALFVAFLLTIFSFYPRTDISRILAELLSLSRDPNERDNLIYFQDIAKYSPETYLIKLEAGFSIKVSGEKGLEDLIAQIVVNARVATQKINLFKIAAWLIVVGQATLLLSFIF